MTATPAPAASAPSYTFTEGEVPTLPASIAENPFTDAVKGLLATWNESEHKSLKSLTFTVADGDLVKVKRQLALAGTVVDRSIKTRQGKGTLTFWLVPAIKRVATPETVAKRAARKAALAARTPAQVEADKAKRAAAKAAKK